MAHDGNLSYLLEIVQHLVLREFFFNENVRIDVNFVYCKHKNLFRDL